MLRVGEQMRGPGCYAQPVIRKFRGTIASGVVTAVAGECDAGISVGTFSSGASTVTLSPRPKKCSFLSGYVHNSAETGSSIQMMIPSTVYDSSAGTLVIKTLDLATPTVENADDTNVLEFFLLLDEGSA